jgi:hypothetical protein
MGLTEAIAFFVVLKLGFRWVRSWIGQTFHVIFCLLLPAVRIASYFFERGEPNSIVVCRAMTITLIPSLYFIVLY